MGEWPGVPAVIVCTICVPGTMAWSKFLRPVRVMTPDRRELVVQLTCCEQEMYARWFVRRTGAVIRTRGVGEVTVDSWYDPTVKQGPCGYVFISCMWPP